MSRWLEIAITTSQEQVETVANVFNEMGSGGVVIEDPALIIDLIKNGNAETIAPQLKHSSSKDFVVKGYFFCDCYISDRLEELSRRLNELSIYWCTREIKEEDWATGWRAYYKPVRIGKNLTVKPSWEDYTARPGECVIELDPGMAFGCGTHATTAMCLALLEEMIKGGEIVYDVGAGSGILSVAAALLGVRQVIAVDIDELAVQTVKENAARNGVTNKVKVKQGDLLNNFKNDKVDIVVANIIADIIIRLAPDAVEVLKPEGQLIASGIILDRAEEVRQALRHAGFNVLREESRGEWVAMVCQKEQN